MNVAGALALSARRALTSPLPSNPFSSGVLYSSIASAVSKRTAVISLFVYRGLIDLISAATPLTCGAANEVPRQKPLYDAVNGEPSAEFLACAPTISTAGAFKSMHVFPKFENSVLMLFLSTAPTPITSCSLALPKHAGYDGRSSKLPPDNFVVDPAASFPIAATTSTPRSKA